MGTYLSTPVTEKCKEEGDSLECPVVPVSWGVVDMQGWRKSMEDAHVAQTDIPVPAYHIEQQQQLLQHDEAAKAAVAAADGKVFGVFDGHGGPEVARFCQLYLVSVLTQQSAWKEESLTTSTETNPALKGVGHALVSAFHALDRMIDDPSRRDEIFHLRNLKPQPGERREAVSIPPLVPMDSDVAPPTSGGFPSLVTAHSAEEESPSSDAPPADTGESANTDNDDNNKASGDSQPQEKTDESTVGGTEAESGKKADEEIREDAPVDESRKEKPDDDSDEVVGKDEASELDQDMMDDADGAKDPAEQEDNDQSNNSKVTAMFQKILSLGGSNQSGQVVMKVGETNDEAKANAPAAVAAAPPAGPTISQASIIHNGRMTCNLPDHPIHAGATAIVAVLVGRVLTVANAGDSRAVLCRAGGKTVPLSYDHKPQQEREMTRINKAGGFVNHFGRVNGNLNLSRSIGDLKYKQVVGIPPSGQMITAEPDIMQLTLDESDEFLILGCDGIWDCLTNEKAVEFVRNRIDRMTPTEIGIEMLDTIISEDPRATQGIGGDNMTIMVVDLQPSSRKRPGNNAAELPPSSAPPTTPE